MMFLFAFVILASVTAMVIFVWDRQRRQNDLIRKLQDDVARLHQQISGLPFESVEETGSAEAGGPDTPAIAKSEYRAIQRSDLIPKARLGEAHPESETKPVPSSSEYGSGGFVARSDQESGTREERQDNADSEYPQQSASDEATDTSGQPHEAASESGSDRDSSDNTALEAEAENGLAPDSDEEHYRDEEQSSRFDLPRLDLEELFGRRLPIWAGGVALAIAGFFLVRYSIEKGLLSPSIRIILGFAFGLGLLAVAELAFRQETRIRDPRVRQAFAGAGLATLYGCFYMAGNEYGLIGSGVAFFGLAMVTAAAIGLSFRFGLPCAILGLIGGFAAPLLVGSDEANLPLLSIYLALVTSALNYSGARQGHGWLALAALAGGLGWGMLLLLSGVSGDMEVLALGGYFVLLGTLALAPNKGEQVSPWLQIPPTSLAAFQLAAMVYQSGFTLLAWGLYGLLGASLAFFAWRDSRLKPAFGFAGLLGIMMAGLWPAPSLLAVVAVIIMLLAIFAVIPLAAMWRGQDGWIDSVQLSGTALATIALILFHFSGVGPKNLLALAVLGISLLPTLGAWIAWPEDDEHLATSSLVCTAGAAIGIIIAGLVATPAWAAPLIVAIVAMGIIGLNWRRVDPGLLNLSWAGAGASIIALLSSPESAEELFQLVSDNLGETEQWRAVFRWIAASVPFLALAWQKQGLVGQRIAAIFAAFGTYGVAAQFLPAEALAWFAALMAIMLAYWLRDRIAARLTFTVLALAWAIPMLAIWTFAALQSLEEQPMMIAGQISMRDIGLYLLPMLAACAALIWRPAHLAQGKRIMPVWAFLGFASLVAIHILYKQVFALDGEADFVTWGLAERTVWEALLLAGALVISQIGTRIARADLIARILALAALLHFGFYSFLMYNPLWAEQTVGSVPILNWMTVGYGVALAALWQLKRLDLNKTGRMAADIATMVLIAFLALSVLRNIFAGPMLVSTPVGQLEDLLRSVLGIVLAIGYLLWGARSHNRTFRIGSLVLMLLSVVKVFIFDTAGLEGLARIASFMALGLSLIGIGWFYSRQLSAPKAGNNGSGESEV